MNVSKEADAALMRELQDADPIRYARLHKNMLRGRAAKSGWIVGKCSRCQVDIHNAPFLSASEPGKFCSRDCRDNGANRSAKRGRPKGAKDRSFITRSNKKYASSADRVRAFRERESLQTCG